MDVTSELQQVWSLVRGVKLSAEDHTKVTTMMNNIINAVNSDEGFCKTEEDKEE